VAQVGAQGGDGGGRAETARQQADAVQLLELLTVNDVGLAARNVLHEPGIHEDHVEAPSLDDLVERSACSTSPPTRPRS
jgi:hypothetical protein